MTALWKIPSVPLGEREHLRVRVDPGPIITDVAVVRLPEHDVDGRGVRGPDREPQAGGLGAVAEDLARAQPARVGEIEVLVVRSLIGGQGEFAVSLHRVHVLDLGRYPPDVRTGRAVEAHAPAKPLADLSGVEVHGRGEAGAAILSPPRRHGGFAPDRREPPRPVPASHEPRVAEQLPLQPRQIPKPDCQHRHAFLLHCGLDAVEGPLQLPGTSAPFSQVLKFPRTLTEYATGAHTRTPRRREICPILRSAPAAGNSLPARSGLSPLHEMPSRTHRT